MMNGTKLKEPSSLDRAFVKRSAWLGAKIAFVVLAPISASCLLWFSSMFLYKCCALHMSPISVLKAADPSNLTKIVNGLVSLFSLVAVGVVVSAGMGAAVAASAVGCHKLRGRFARHTLRD